MKRWSGGALIRTIAISIAVWAVIAILCSLVGSSRTLGWPRPFIVVDEQGHHSLNQILGIRFGMILLASLIGAALGSAGVVYQAILRNPLADPYLLGVSSGASLFAFVWRLPRQIAFATKVIVALGQQASSFLGAIISVGTVLLLARKRGRLEPVTLLLVGVIVNAINAAIFLLIYSLFPEGAAATGSAFGFLVGGIQTNLTFAQEAFAAIVFLIGWLVLIYLSGQLNAAMLSEAEAESLGVSIQRVRWTALIVASIVTAAAVAVSGPIGFVGLICPHLTRMIVGQDQRRLLPASTAAGAALLAIADAATRLLSGAKFVNTFLPVGVLTALLGGPFFLFLLWRNRRQLQ
ncbi:MAG TPA: iron ABC transporter permease [Humisphaera sp.]|jgi:iron complex transport system permease protein|nr:iron ABC transporter permease [Humisphaera sp.]